MRRLQAFVFFLLWVCREFGRTNLRTDRCCWELNDKRLVGDRCAINFLRFSIDEESNRIDWRVRANRHCVQKITNAIFIYRFSLRFASVDQQMVYRRRSKFLRAARQRRRATGHSLKDFLKRRCNGESCFRALRNFYDRERYKFQGSRRVQFCNSFRRGDFDSRRHVSSA